MKTEQATVTEVLPRGMYLVALDSGRRLRVGLPSSSKHGLVRIIAGDRVEVRLAQNDPNRGQILKKL